MKKTTLSIAIALAAPIAFGALGAMNAIAAAAAPAVQDSRLAEQEQPEQRVTFEHRAFSSLLKRHVHGDLVDYKGLNRDRAMLDMYAASLAAVTPTEMMQWDRAERMAFWINVYNAYTLQLILDNLDQGDGKLLDSITSINEGDNNAWNLAVIPMAAFHPDKKRMNLTLDQIENKILRPQFGDARIHAAVNCASIGCPPLRAEAFTGADLEQQLSEQMEAFMASTTRNTFDKPGNKVELSNIFDWYGDDFKSAATAAKRATDLRDYLIENGPESAGATAEDRSWIRDAEVGFGEYDWKLNVY
jgi:hypothetical protein